MKRQSAKQKVRAVYPQALVIEDMDVYYPSEWASKAKFSVGFFKNQPEDLDITQVYQTTYEAVTTGHDWVFISGWQANPTAAWKAGWEAISRQMILKLEQK
jgi:hypothetical protein